MNDMAPPPSFARARGDSGAAVVEAGLAMPVLLWLVLMLVDFAMHADYRAAVKKEFDGIKALFGEYQAALKKVYPVPVVPDAK